jgi:hypothetical protein
MIAKVIPAVLLLKGVKMNNNQLPLIATFNAGKDGKKDITM